MKINNYICGAILCLVATVSWGIMFPVMRHALISIDCFTFTAMRYTIAGIIFLIILYVKEGTLAFRLDGNLVLLWLLGSAGFAGFGFLVFLGQKLAGPQAALSASMVMATMPMLGMLVNWILKGTKPLTTSIAFIMMSLLGVVLVITGRDFLLIFSVKSNYWANLLILAGALCWVIYTLGANYFPRWSAIKYTSFSILFGLPTIYLITIFLILNGSVSLPTFKTVTYIFPELAYMAFVAGFIGVLCWNYGNKIITPINGVLFMDVVPVTTFIVSTIEGIAPTPVQVVGMIITVAALILNNLYQRKNLARVNKM